MQILDQAPIFKAWYEYVTNGIIREDLLRPQIIASWKRSPKLSYNRLKSFDKISSDILTKLQKENTAFMDAAMAVISYIVTVSPDCIVMLCDKEGNSIKSFHRYKHQISIDTCYAEEIVGCNAAGLALIENQPAFVSGFEHLIVNWHSVTSAAVPIKGPNGSILGILDIAYPFNKKPIFSMESLKAAASIIEDSLVDQKRDNIESSRHFETFINGMRNPVIIVNNEGITTNINDKLLKSLGNPNKETFINRHILDYIDTKSASLVRSGGLINIPRSHVVTINSGRKTDNTNALFMVINANGPINVNHNVVILQEYKATNQQTSKQKASGTLLGSHQNGNSNNFTNVIIGQSEAITNIRHIVKKIARIPSSVLIQGESGTGKELVARTIHNASGRKGHFVPVNCGALPKELIESELFGYDEGSFTGANKGGKMGKFEMADTGTLFLDEIGEMPFQMQVALLRFLEDKIVVRLGSTKPVKTDVRIIAATNRNLITDIGNQSFRQDLYFRLNVVNIHLPPLRDIKSDIPLIGRHILNCLCKTLGIKRLEIHQDALDFLCEYDWPGNIRELRNVLERAAIYCESNSINADLIAFCLDTHSQKGIQKYSEKIQSDREIIIEKLKYHNWNISQTAKFMGISRKKVYDMLKYGD